MPSCLTWRLAILLTLHPTQLTARTMGVRNKHSSAVNSPLIENAHVKNGERDFDTPARTLRAVAVSGA